MPSDSPLIIGHRGAPGYRPEHSRSSYKLALAMGVGAVEPDIVPTADGVLVIRHENEISGTTDVADRPEFADRLTTKSADGHSFTGWFTEDFTWAELQTLRCRERLPKLRPGSAAFDDQEPILSLRELLDLVREEAAEQQSEIGLVLEVKHASYFESIGLDLAPLIQRELSESGFLGSGLPLVIESFEQTVLNRLRDIPASLVYLIEASGSAFDLVATLGEAAPSYRSQITAAGLDALVGDVDGISVDKALLLEPGNTIVADAHERGLTVFTWTCRPESAFLDPRFRIGVDPGTFGDYEAEWAEIAAQGVDGVFVDHPDLGVAFFEGSELD